MTRRSARAVRQEEARRPARFSSQTMRRAEPAGVLVLLGARCAREPWSVQEDAAVAEHAAAALFWDE